MKNDLEKLYKSAEKFLTPLTLPQTYSTIIKELSKLAQGNYGSIVLIQNGQLQRVFTTIPKNYQVESRRRGFTYQAYKSQKTMIIDRNKIISIHPEFKKTQVKYLILIPLSYSKKSIGVLSLYVNKKKVFMEKDLKTLKLYGSLAILAIRKNQLYKEAQDALNARELFISMAAHELRTPLTTMSAYVQLLDKQAYEKKSINKDWIKQLNKATGRLKKLVHELLQTEKMKKGDLDYHYEQMNLKSIVDQAIIDFQISHSNYELKFHNKLNGQNDTFYGDEDKLIQALNNILNNAAKFSPTSSKIILTLESTNSSFVIMVKDQGKGISQENLPKIFSKFYKVAPKDTEGIGLGLYLTKKIIDRHQGSISITSKLHKGTTVKVLLPYKKNVRRKSL